MREYFENRGTRNAEILPKKVRNAGGRNAELGIPHIPGPRDPRTFEEVLKAVNDEKDRYQMRLLERCETVVMSLKIFEIQHFIAGLDSYGVWPLVNKIYDGGVEELLNTLKMVKKQSNGKYAFIGVLDEGLKASALVPRSLKVAETREMAEEATGPSRFPGNKYEKKKKPAALMPPSIPSSSKKAGTTTSATGQPQLSARQPVAKKVTIAIKPYDDKRWKKDGWTECVEKKENNKENKTTEVVKTTGHGGEEPEKVKKPSEQEKETDVNESLAEDFAKPVEEEEIEKSAADEGNEVVSGEPKATGHPTATEELEEPVEVEKDLNGSTPVAMEGEGDGNATKEVPMVSGETTTEKESADGGEGDVGQSRATDGLEKPTGETTGAVEKTAATGQPSDCTQQIPTGPKTSSIIRNAPRKRRYRLGHVVVEEPEEEEEVAPLVPKTEPVDEQETVTEENHENNVTENEEGNDFGDVPAEEEEETNEGQLPGDDVANNAGDGQRETVPIHLRNVAFKREPCDVITLDDDDEEEMAPPARRRRVENEAHGQLQMAAAAAPAFGLIGAAPNNLPQGMTWEQAFLLQMQQTMAVAQPVNKGPSSKHEHFGRYIAHTLDEIVKSGRSVDEITMKIIAIFRDDNN